MRNPSEISSLYYTGPQARSYSKGCPYNLTNVNIQNEIDRIIAERARHGARLDQAEALLKSVSGTVEDFLTQKKRLFGTQEKAREFFGDARQQEADLFFSRLAAMDETNLADLGRRCSDISRLISNARRRFRRKSLCIAIVGNSGEGKSTLIQKITGLNDATIPSAGAGICTAARSKIINESRFCARIEFYTRHEFITEVLAPYFVHFGVLRDAQDLTDIGHACELLGQINVSRKDQYYSRICEYCDMWSSYRDYLDRPMLELTDESEVREYVAKVSSTGDKFESRKYMAVKSVEIECPFPTVDVKSLILIDTIGVNEPTLNVKKQMLDTISEEADFVLFTKRSFADRMAWMDTDSLELYFDILRNLPGIPAYRWVYFVLNYTDGVSIKTGTDGKTYDGFAGNFEAVRDNLRDHPADHDPGAFIDVNCMDQQEVADYLIKPILSHLAQNLHDIDMLHIQRINTALAELATPLGALAAEAAGYELAPIDDREIEITLIPGVLSEMVRSLMDAADSICAELRSTEDNQTWRMKVRESVANCESLIPPLEQISQIYRDRNSALRTIDEVYAITSNNLCHMFDKEDFQFDDMICGVKEKFFTALMQACRFDQVPELAGIDPSAPDAFDSLAELLFGDNVICDPLRTEFDHFSRFTIEHGRTLSQWMAETVRCIDPNNGDGNIPSFWKEIGLEKAIVEKLRTNMDAIRQSILEKASLLDSPENRTCSVLNQFVSTITQLGGDTHTAWTLVMHRYLRVMHPEQFSSTTLYNKRAEMWNSLIRTLQGVRSLEQIDFSLA